MPTYIMLSRLTESGAETIRQNPGRIQEVNRELEAMGVRVLQQYAVLGPYDFVNIVEAPDVGTVMRASVELSSRGSVRIETLAAVPMDEFVRLFR
ncbi:MAG: GYD domain-containing protein [Armatimonadota bacterium]|nr:GYD domain-containing protein [Armatimonadota bacterium]MDR7440427.1 GYD domain-containing protein [Armatimonadota bacterium]MDR7444955.1 GYD domain-containing protein [Armatimonadota bacterium]MDR7570540.1 GYD domain-containing protein [Armatimonadota bacterium]MDR7615110.1 GYD domain-containing protein [Armatimonadota bacterium]